MRVELLESDGARAATLRLGRQRTGRTLTATWQPQLEAGSYTARLRATPIARGRPARSSTRSRRFEVTAPPVIASSGVFPVQGAYSFGGEGARFGAERPGHAHQGQDIVAAAGTPVVSPQPGVVTWRAYQAAGAGHYVVVRADDGRELVFMHFQDGSVAVSKNQRVAAGQLLGRVGSTGRSDGPHLHFEIWPDGWYAGNGSMPIDPLADLLAWADLDLARVSAVHDPERERLGGSGVGVGRLAALGEQPRQRVGRERAGDVEALREVAAEAREPLPRLV